MVFFACSSSKSFSLPNSFSQISLSIFIEMMSDKSLRSIGLTGGIATGKTTVTNYLSDRYHIPILDADIYAREAVKPNSPILAEIFARYGSNLQLPDGTLDRQRLGEIIFNDLEEKQWLESKIHPYVRDRFRREIEKLEVKIIVLAIPLLFEAKLTHLASEIWVVYCSPQEQIRRLMERNNLTQAQAIARIQNQLPIDKKVALADVVLDNSSDLEQLFQQCDRALNLKQ
jgi:dephospho-CoA kinase